MKKFNVGIVGATGMVGQRFMTDRKSTRLNSSHRL